VSSILTGRIIKGVGGSYQVVTDIGEFTCQARGLFRKEGITPLVGDFTRISVVDEEKQSGYLLEILPRKNELNRPKIANIDQAVFVCAIVPPISFEVMDAFLINCEEQNVSAILCINKIDLDNEKEYQEVIKSYEKAKYKVLAVSAASGFGLKELHETIEGKTSILAGPSGVGKSSIFNRLYPQYSLAVGELSTKISRGKHTTRHTSLLKVSDNTFLVDSPGFTSFSINHINKENLQYNYPEFKPYLDECYYNNCIHISEHDCAVKAQIGLNIDIGRYNRYVRFVKGAN